MTPHNKVSISSHRKIDFAYDKSKRSVRQIYSNVKDYDSFSENPKKMMDIRKKLNLTAGYSDAISSGKLRNYGTNTSNQSQNNLEKNIKLRKKIIDEFKPLPGAFLKNQNRKNQPKIEKQMYDPQKNNYLENDKYSSLSNKKSDSKKRAKKDQLRKQLFNQNTGLLSRLGAQKINSVRGIKGKFLKMGDKYTSSRMIKNPKGLKYENFQSYRAQGGKSKKKILREDLEHRFNSNKYDSNFKEGNLETREAIERFADYIAEKGNSKDMKDSLDNQVKIGSISAQISPKMIHKAINFFPNNK
jgi:hypothetical protein